MVLATIDGGLYKSCLVLHILCAIVGFGAVFLNGIYGQQMKARLQSGRVAEALGDLRGQHDGLEDRRVLHLRGLHLRVRACSA